MPKRATVMPEHLQASFDGLRAHGLLRDVHSLDEAMAQPCTSRLVRAHAVAIARGHSPYGRHAAKPTASTAKLVLRLTQPPAQQDRKRLAAGDFDE